MCQMFKVIIAGPRDFNDYFFLYEKCAHLLQNYKPQDLQIVSGGAKGVDALGERFAEEMGIDVKQFPADWSIGLKAGPIRNRQMAQYADALIAFQPKECKTKGTVNMMNTARELGLKVKVVYF